MQSKTSFFNKTIFRKNLTRFAPVWGLYGLSLCLWLVLNRAANSAPETDAYWGAKHLAELVPVMALANLGYGLLMAQLLFGDLYSSRMCNMLHAYPLRREGWYLTNYLSGLASSLIPTAAMCLFSYLFLIDTVFVNAWQLPLYLFVGSNLQFIVFFSLATFAAMCVGTRFTMAAGYALLNFGAVLTWFLVDSMLTSKLYGVITPTRLSNALTPAVGLSFDADYFKTTSFTEVMNPRGGGIQENAVATFTLGSAWSQLLIWVGIGLVFALLGLVLYKKRHLECAGDAVAFPILVPVFHVLCALSVGGAFQVLLYTMMGLKGSLWQLLVGILVGWFLGKMLTERSARVFRLKNCYGLAGLLAALGLVLGGTSIDILGIEDRVPDPEDVESVVLRTYAIGNSTDTEDVELAIRIQELCLETRLEEVGTYILDENGEYVLYDFEQPDQPDQPPPDYMNATNVYLTYHKKDGSTMQRNYPLRPDTPEGQLVKEYTSRWEVITAGTAIVDGKEYNRLENALDTFDKFTITGSIQPMDPVWSDREILDALLECLKADAAAGNLSQDEAFHTGFFRSEDEYSDTGYYDRAYIWLDIRGKNTVWDIEIYPDCENTVTFLQELGLLDMEVHHTPMPLW